MSNRDRSRTRGSWDQVQLRGRIETNDRNVTTQVEFRSEQMRDTGLGPVTKIGLEPMTDTGLEPGTMMGLEPKRDTGSCLASVRDSIRATDGEIFIRRPVSLPWY